MSKLVGKQELGVKSMEGQIVDREIAEAVLTEMGYGNVSLDNWPAEGYVLGSAECEQAVLAAVRVENLRFAKAVYGIARKARLEQIGGPNDGG